MAMMPPMAVVEMPEFLNRAKAILTEVERTALVAHLGANPEGGQLVPGTGASGRSDGGHQAKENAAARE